MNHAAKKYIILGTLQLKCAYWDKNIDTGFINLEYRATEQEIHYRCHAILFFLRFKILLALEKLCFRKKQTQPRKNVLHH